MSRRRETIVAAALGLAVFLQAVGLVVRGELPLSSTVQLLAVGLGAAAAVAVTWRTRMRLNHRIDMLLVMAGVGGLGMLLGSWVDAWMAPAASMGHHGMHHHAASAWAMVPTFMTGMMLITAIPAAVALTRCAELARTSLRRFLSTHVVGNAVMVVAMVWVGHWLGPGLGGLTGSFAVGHHLAMLLGMLVGMELGMFAGEAALGLKPWREWRWQEDWEEVLVREGGARPTQPRRV